MDIVVDGTGCWWRVVAVEVGGRFGVRKEDSLGQEEEDGEGARLEEGKIGNAHFWLGC